MKTAIKPAKIFVSKSKPAPKKTPQPKIGSPAKPKPKAPSPRDRATPLALTSITVVLDRSGSMAVIAAETIGGYNAFVEEQKKGDGKATLTLNQFDHQFETIYKEMDVMRAPKLTPTTYVPRGNTALLDAIGRSIDSSESAKGKVVMVIITDGLENASQEYSRSMINKMITEKKALGWEFVFLAANQDAIATGTSLGVSAGSTMTYDANSAGTQVLFASTSKNLCSVRSGGSSDMSYSTSQRKRASAGYKTQSPGTTTTT